jgi:hypothetical protein
MERSPARGVKQHNRRIHREMRRMARVSEQGGARPRHAATARRRTPPHAADKLTLARSSVALDS